MKDRDLEEKHESSFLFYKDGEVIFAENSPGKEIYIIESGKVEISQRLDGTKTPIVVLEKGAFFGEMAPITNTLRSATATAIENVFLTSFSMEEMIERMRIDDVFMVTVLQRLISRLRNTTSRLRTLSFTST